MIDQLSYFFIFFGGFMSWTMALGKFLENEKHAYHYFFGGLMFCLGSLQILDGLLVMGIIGDFSVFIFWHLPLLAWIGPFFFFAFKAANDDFFILKAANYLHFLPGFIVILFMIPLLIMDSHTKVAFIMQAPDVISSNPLFQMYSGLFLAVTSILIAYMVYFFKVCFFMTDIKLIREKRISPYIVIIMIAILPFQLIFFGGMLIMGFSGNGSHSYILVIQFLTAFSFFLPLVLLVMEKKKINFFKVLKSQISQRQYDISKLKDLDVSLVLTRIQSLLEEEKIFCDETLSVNVMAEKLYIKPYQLSLIINENFGKNFNYFVNEYRIDEAKKLFLKDNARTVISIAYEVGFNSTSVFNEWFKRITGISPKQFRSTNKN